MLRWLLTNCKNGISSYEVSRDLGVSQKSAWHMMHRIRLAMQDDLTGGKLGGEVEIDETFIGGKARFMHKSDRRRKNLKGGGRSAGKAIVLGILERESEDKPKRVRATVIPDRTKPVNARKHLTARLRPVRRSIRMRLATTLAWTRNTHTRLSTMQRRMCGVTYIPTAWRTSGVF